MLVSAFIFGFPDQDFISIKIQCSVSQNSPGYIIALTFILSSALGQAELLSHKIQVFKNLRIDRGSRLKTFLKFYPFMR